MSALICDIYSKLSASLKELNQRISVINARIDELKNKYNI